MCAIATSSIGLVLFREFWRRPKVMHHRSGIGARKTVHCGRTNVMWLTTRLVALFNGDESRPPPGLGRTRRTGRHSQGRAGCSTKYLELCKHITRHDRDENNIAGIVEIEP